MARIVCLVCGIVCGTVCWLAAPARLAAEPRKKARREVLTAADSVTVDAAAADSKPGDAKSVELTPEAIQKRLKLAEEGTALDPVVKKGVVDSYNEALEHVKTAGEHAAKAEGFRKATIEAPREMQRVKAKLQSPRLDLSPQISPDMGMSEMQQALAESENAYEALQKKLDELQSEPSRRAERRKKIPELQRDAQRMMEEIDTSLDPAQAAGTATDPVAAADSMRRLAHRHALERELLVYEEELRHYETTSDLVEARRDHALLLVEQAERQMKAWREAVNDRRRQEAERESRAALHAAKHAPPAIRRLAEDNAALAAQRQDLVARIEIACKEQDALQNQVQVLEALFDRVKERVKRVGLTESIGVLLRKQREAIPNVAEHQKFIEERKAEIAKLNLQLVDLEDQRGELADIDERVAHLLKESHGGRKTRKSPTEAEIRKILEDSRGYLDSQIKDTNAYEDLLHKLNVTEAELVTKAAEFSQFTKEYILWIKSAEPPAMADAREFWSSVGWLLLRKNWSPVIDKFSGDLRLRPTNYLAIFAVIVTLALSQRLWRRLLRNAGRDAADHHTTSIRSTGVAFFSTLMLTLLWPGTLWLAGWRLAQLAGREEFLLAVARGFEGAAFFLVTINFTRHLCRSLGLGESHFTWPTGSLDVIRRNMWWQAAVGLPLTLVVLITESQAEETIKNTLGRAAFVGLQGLLLASAHSVWHAPCGFSHNLAQAKASGRTDRWWLRLCRLAQVASFAAPAALAALAIVGYYYTAVQLAQRVLATSWLVGGLFVLHASMLRWLLLAYRDLAKKRAKELRAPDSSSKSPIERHSEAAGAEPTVRLADINQQTHKLLGLVVCTAFLFASSVIWVEVLPALEVLDTVQLWPHPFTIFDPSAERDTKFYCLTLGQLLAAVLVGLATAAAARNVPGLIEITILRNLKLDSGARYAVSAVTQYAITACGLALAFSCVGVGWNNVQWLVAAMTVGLGFGLQEIFANFASGLLLLIERPIRVGDLVSIGDVTGKVSRIRIRATTITDGDMREAIVPNREFISGKVMNWTLTDSTARMSFTVRVPNGCNPDHVKQVLLRVALAHPLVLKDPPPHALLDEFAVDKLTFTLRVYMASCDVYNKLRHELNAGIRSAFIKSGIDKTTVEDEPVAIVHSPPQAA
jgi:potassium efflux system protein